MFFERIVHLWEEQLPGPSPDGGDAYPDLLGR